MRKYNVVTVRKYTDGQGNEKKQWNTIGSLVFFPANGNKPDGYKLELNMFPETKYFVFEMKPREDRGEGVSRAPEESVSDPF